MKRKQRGGEGEYTNVPAGPNTNNGILKKAANAVTGVTNSVANMFGTTTQAGGKKKTRKPSPWAKAVGKLYHEMQRKDKKATFVDALKEASKLKKAGKFNY